MNSTQPQVEQFNFLDFKYEIKGIKALDDQIWFENSVKNFFFLLDFQKLSSTVQEFLLKLPDEETSARLRDNLLHALHFLQLYYRVLQSRDKNNDPLQWTIDHSLSPLTPFREAPDKFEWDWINVDSPKVRQSLSKSSIENFRILPQIITAIKDGDLNTVRQLVKQGSFASN